MITQIRILILLPLLLSVSFGLAQTWNDLSSKEQKKALRLWPKLTYSATVSLNDSSLKTGQILFSTDSGIVWRSVPQYLPYSSENVQLIPYREIYWLQTNRLGHLGRHIANGGIVGAALGTGFAYLGTSVSGVFHPDEGFSYSLAAMAIGAGTGLISGLIIDKIRSQRKVYAPDAKKVRQVKALYPPKKENSWRKHWIDNDSLIGGYSLPPNLDKLAPFFNSWKLEFSGHMNSSTDLIYDYSLQNGNIGRFGDRYERPPFTFEFRLAYRIKPWLKLGMLTHRMIIDGKYVQFNHTELNTIYFQAGDGYLRTNYERTFGLFAEFTPFPVKYLAFRNWEPFLGLGILREKGRISLNYDFDYITHDREEYKTGLSEHQQFHHPSGLGFIGMRFYTNRRLSFEAQLGQYVSRTLRFQPATMELVDPYPDFVFHLKGMNLSRTYLSLSTSVRL